MGSAAVEVSDASGNFAAVRREFDGRAIGNFRPLGADDAGGIGPDHEFGKEISDTFLIGGGKLSPTWTHGLAGDEIKGERFFQGRAHARGQVFVSVPGVGDRENFVNGTAEHGRRVIDEAALERRTVPRMKSSKIDFRMGWNRLSRIII